MIEDDTVSNEERLKARLESLKKTYNQSGKLAWMQYLSAVNGDVSLSLTDLQEDFNREVKFYAVALENAKNVIEKLQKQGVPVWRPNDYKAETFKNDYHMKKVQNYLSDISKKIEVVEKRKDAKNKKKFSNEAHKRHVKSKQLKVREQKSRKIKASKGKSARYMRNKKRN